MTQLVLNENRGGLLVDVDSTLFPFLDALAAVPGVDEFDLANIGDWEDLARRFGSSARFYAAAAVASSPTIALQFAPYAGSVEHLAAARDDGRPIHVVSARPSTATEETRTWLQEFDVPFDEVVCGRGIDKIAYAQAHGLTAVAEDSPHALERAHLAGLHALAVLWPWNAEVVARYDLIHTAVPWSFDFASILGIEGFSSAPLQTMEV